MEESRTKKTFINTAAGILVKITALVTSFVLRTVFIKTLGMEYNGISGLFTDILTILSFAELGMGTAITHALYSPIALNDEQQISMLIGFFKGAYRLIALVVFLGGLALIPFLDFFVTNAPDVRESIKQIFFLYIINTSCSYLFIYKATLFIANQQEYIISRWTFAVNLVQVMVQIILLFLFRDFLLYLIVNILGTVVQNRIISSSVDKQFAFINQKKGEKLPKQRVREILADVKALLLYKVSGVVLNGTDSIIISRLLGVVVVGVLSNYKLITNQINNIIQQFFGSTTASIGNLAAKEDAEHQFTVFHKLLFLCFWCYCFCSTSLFVLLNPFIGDVWLDKKYTFSIWFVAVMTAEFYLRGMMSPISSFRTANGLFVNGKYRPVAMAAMNIVFSIILAKYIGVTGIILGTVISRLLTQIWYDPLLLYQKVFHKDFRGFAKRYSSYLFITGLSCAVTQFVSGLVTLSNVYVNFLFKVVLCLLVPNALVILTYWTTPEFEYAKQTLFRFGGVLKKKIGRGSVA